MDDDDRLFDSGERGYIHVCTVLGHGCHNISQHAISKIAAMRHCRTSSMTKFKLANRYQKGKVYVGWIY